MGQKTFVMKQIFFFLISLIFIASCITNRQTAKTQTAECNSIKLLKSPSDSLRIDPYDIDSLKIVDDCLGIYVSYGGGCGNADFGLYLTDRIMESMPPKTVLYLAFADDDPCRSIETKKLTFSLEPFKRYAEGGGIYLKIAGTDKSILYQISK